MDMKDLLGEFAKGAKKGAGPFKPEVTLNVSLTDEMREDLENILQNLDSITEKRFLEFRNNLNPLVRDSIRKLEYRWKITQYLLVIGFVVNGAIAVFLN
jgi:predicted nucleic acid-binding OB-fold protein